MSSISSRHWEERGAEEGNMLFTRIPVEIQMEVLRYLDPASVRGMRLVNSTWNEGVKNLVSFDYKAATLSDKTASAVLPFTSPIRSLTARDLTNKRRVLTAIHPFGVVHWAQELILGPRIDPRITKKLLKTATEVESLALSPMDPTVGEAFLRFPALFENVTQFQLKVRMSLIPSELRAEEVLLRKLGHWRKFPNLTSYSVAWSLESYTTVEQKETVLLLHGIYISLHNFLYTHRATVQKLSWDVGNLIVVGLPGYLENVGDYMDVKKRMTQVAVKEVVVRMGDMEGQDYWDLNKTLLRHQHSLTRISFTGDLTPYSSRPFQYITYPFSVAMELVERNQGSLIDLYIENRVFSFYSLEGCGELRKLVLKGASIISTSPLNYNHHHYEVEELELDFKFVLPADVRNLMNWFPKLVKLRTLVLRLRVRTTTEMFPNTPDFLKLLSLPRLEVLRLHFDTSTAYKLHVVKGKGVEWRRGLEGQNGVEITEVHSFLEKSFAIGVKLDRGRFKGLPQLQG